MNRSLRSFLATLPAVVLFSGCIVSPDDDDDAPMGATSAATASASASASGSATAATESGSDSASESGSESGSETTSSEGMTTSGSSSGSGDGSSTGPGTDTPPELAITQPMMDLTGDGGPTYDDFDEDLELWYADVDVTATATDAEDGDLARSIEWTTDQGAIQDAELGTGGTTTIRLYSDECFGTEHSITATVVDSDGNEVTAERVINIWTLC